MRKCPLPAPSKNKGPLLPPVTTKSNKPNCHCGHCPCAKESWSDDDEDFDIDESDSEAKRHSMIRKNMREIKAMSKHVRQSRRVKCLEESKRKPFPSTSKKEPKKKKKKPRKKSSLLEMIPDERECACEIMARAAAASLHRHVGLYDRRADINADLREPEPVPETTEQPGPAP
ncbi:uncharacterized protein C45G9.9-like [Pectinophora gossypiella]|uniref:uncharacterized protein C45G9.9-like n=1 Tax=Pectinophora gossypiella TaxID=13191 RepID=UPI00214E026A|nr:uncharacterized protein C45G9.9-like [Pectinophora gossypiella]